MTSLVAKTVKASAYNAGDPVLIPGWGRAGGEEEDEELKVSRKKIQIKKKQSEVTQSCPTLHDPMYCSLSGSSVHGIFQTRVLE